MIKVDNLLDNVKEMNINFNMVGGKQTPTEESAEDILKQYEVPEGTRKEPYVEILDRATDKQIQTIDMISNILGVPYSDEQKAVILHDGAPLNIVSCAGSGKTAVLIARQLYRSVEHRIKPYNMLSVTFNAKAKEEIEQRYHAGKKGLNLYGSPDFKTFHGLFLKLITNLDGYTDINVAGEGKYTFQLLKLVEKNDSEDTNEVLQQMFRLRSYLINNSISKDGIENSATDSKMFTHENYIKVMTRYEELKRENDEIDFDDMLVVIHEAVHENKDDIVDKFRKIYHDVYIDEYQDISKIQIEIMDTLIGDYNRLTAIGDDDQAIYGFRGSDPSYIVDFTERYTGAERLYLSTNYRCKANILNVVKPSIEVNEMRVDKKIEAFNDGGNAYINSNDGYEEISAKIAEDTEHLYGGAFDEYAILVRTNAQRMILSDTLASKGVKVDIGNISYSLRNNRIYKTIIGILYAIYEEDNDMFAEYGRPMFSMLNSQVVKSYKGDTTKNWYKDYVVDRSRPLPNHLLDLILNIKSSTRADNMIGYVWKGVSDYYQRLSKMGYGSIHRVLEVFKHLFTVSKGLSFDEFLKQENTKEAYIRMYEGSGDAIKILTMHTVKGLEYDNVYLVGVNGDVLPSETRIEQLQKEVTESATPEQGKYLEEKLQEYIEEERRLFYVACTRAKNNLYIHHSTKNPSRFIKELNMDGVTKIGTNVE